MDSETIVVDLSSDGEQDLSPDFNNKEGQKAHGGNFVDLNNYLNSMENSETGGGAGCDDDSDDDSDDDDGDGDDDDDDNNDECMVLDSDPDEPLTDKSDDNGNGSDNLVLFLYK